MTDGKKDQLKRKKTLEYELRRLYRAGELTDQQIAELKEAEFPFDAPVRRTAKSVVRIDDGKRWPSCSAAEKELGITQGWMSDVCNMALRGKWVAIKNQFYCFESMYSPDMDLTEIRGLAGWIVNLETGEMFPTTTEAAKAAGTSRSVVLDHVKNKVKPQNKRFSLVRDWDGKVGRLVDLNVQMICLETDTIYHSYDEICAAIWSDGYGFDHKSLLNSGKEGIVFDGLTWRLLRYDVDFEKRLRETPLICRETGKTFDTLSDLLDLLERKHECCAYDRPCHMYDLQRAIEGGWEYKGFHFEYMVPPSVSGER